MLMDDVVAQARRSTSAGDTRRLAELFDAYTLEMYFGIPNDELGAMIAGIPDDELRRHRRALLAVATFSARDTGDELPPRTARTTPWSGAEPELWKHFAAAWRQRRINDVITAHREMQDLAASIPTVTMPLDRSNGTWAFMLGQAGLSAALAGEFQEALTFFERALLIPPSGGMPFLVRGSHLRAALVHAMCGDRAVARLHQEQAASVPRSSSWIEEQLDAERDLVAALLAGPADVSAAFDVVLALSFQNTGETWPFYIDALSRLGTMSRRSAEARERIQLLRSTGLGGFTGAGFAGSVFGQTMALDALYQDDTAQAALELDTTDRAHWRSQILEGLLTLVDGTDPQRAIRIAEGIADQTSGLRQAENRRLGLLGFAQFQSGDEAAAVETLSAFSGGVPPEIAAVLDALAPRLAALAVELVAGWPAAAGGEPDPLDAPALRQSELRVLEELAQGKKRAAIAESLYISENTVKTHQRALYRKLDVSGATQAVREARRRGIL